MRRRTLVALGFTLPPLLPVLVWPFAGHWRFPRLLPDEWSLRGLRFLFDLGGQAPWAFVTSLGLGVAVAAAAVAVAVPAGMALGRPGIPAALRTAAVFLLLLPIVVPPLAPALGIHLTFVRLGLADTHFGVFLAHLIPAVPYATLVMAAVFDTRDDGNEAAARTLGAGPWRTFTHVTLPEIAPGMAAAAFLAFLASWGQYLLSVLIGGGLVVTLPMLLFSAASGSDPGVTAALGLAFALLPLLVLPFALRAVQPGGPGLPPGKGLLR